LRSKSVKGGPVHGTLGASLRTMLVEEAHDLEATLPGGPLHGVRRTPFGTVLVKPAHDLEVTA